MDEQIQKKRKIMKTQIQNFIGGQFVLPSNPTFMDVECPATGEAFAEVVISGENDVNQAVQVAKAAFTAWSGLTTKVRAMKLHRLYELIRDNSDMLADSIVKEHGKTKSEALAEVAKGNETVEYACSYPILARGSVLEVSRGVRCEDTREPIGVVAHIVPFNFPAMVPLWTIPIALAAGNCVILKPSEKVPVTMNLMAQLFKQAGIPDGVFNIVNGTQEVVVSICKHPEIEAVTFVGSSRVAKIVATTCQQTNKRVLAMGGAKNHLIALPDCEREATASDVVASFTGCAGQRCMAASVLLIVEDETTHFSSDLIDRIVKKSNAIVPGQLDNQMGPVIDQAAVDRISKYIQEAEKRGVKVLVDGRQWKDKPSKGYWIGPTILLHPDGIANDPCLTDEIFGPLISIVKVKSRTEAIKFENGCGYGNAACIYTSSGDNADWFSKRFTSAMIGVNIGVPVPREPFSFGGMGESKFGNHGDVTGDNAIEFFSRRRKITTRWPVAGNSADNMPWFK